MEYAWEDMASGKIKRTKAVEQVETFSLEDLKAERAGLIARRKSIDEDWAAFQAKVAAIKLELGVEDAKLPDVSGKVGAAK
jgi:hypothetical protein